MDNGETQFLFFNCDSGKPQDEETKQDIAAKYGLKKNHIFSLSLHNHSAPLWGKPLPGQPINDETEKQLKYREVALAATYKAIDEAFATRRKARYGFGEGKSYINVNRDCLFEDGYWMTAPNFASVSDKTLAVMKFEDMNSQPIAFFLNYPVHNCVMIGNRCCGGKLGISGDISGSVCRFMEEKFNGSTVIWPSGAAGDVNPLILNEIFYPDPKTGRMAECRLSSGATSVLTMLAARHFADITKAIRNIVCNSESAPIAGTVDWSFTPGRNVVARDDGTTETIVGDGVDPYEIRLHLMRLGDVALYGFSGELYSSLGMRIKEISPMENTIIINHDASLMARSNYIFDDETLARDASNRLPGHRDSHMLPGYILESLEKHTLELFEKLGN